MSDTAVLVLYDHSGQIYLQHRSSYKHRWADYWGTFGGGIEKSETVESALAREILEELTYQVRQPLFLQVQELRIDKKYIFVESYDVTQELIPNKEECQNAGWFFPNDALGLKLIPHDANVVEIVAHFLNETPPIPSVQGG